MRELYDYTDLLAKISACFLLLHEIAPEQGPWTWQNPILQQWLSDRGFRHAYDLGEKDFETILRSLERKLARLHSEENSNEQFTKQG